MVGRDPTRASRPARRPRRHAFTRTALPGGPLGRAARPGCGTPAASDLATVSHGPWRPRRTRPPRRVRTRTALPGGRLGWIAWPRRRATSGRAPVRASRGPWRPRPPRRVRTRTAPGGGWPDRTSRPAWPAAVLGVRDFDDRALGCLGSTASGTRPLRGVCPPRLLAAVGRGQHRARRGALRPGARGDAFPRQRRAGRRARLRGWRAAAPGPEAGRCLLPEAGRCLPAGGRFLACGGHRRARRARGGPAVPGLDVPLLAACRGRRPRRLAARERRDRDRPPRPGDASPGGRLPGPGGGCLGDRLPGLGGDFHAGGCRSSRAPPGVPDPPDHGDLVFFGRRRHSAPDGRLAEVAHLGNQQLGQFLILQDRPGSQPGEHAGGKYIKPEQVVVERYADQRENEHVRCRYARERGNLAQRQRHGEPQVIELVEPLFDAPDVRVGRQIHGHVLLPPGLGQ